MSNTDWICLYGKPPLHVKEATPHVRYACGLRELADWIEEHPGVDLPTKWITVYATDTKENAAATLQALKPCKKSYNDNILSLVRMFGSIELSYMFMRDTVCTPRVIGRRLVEAKMSPAIFTPEKFVPAHEEDIIEWDCEESLLAVPLPNVDESQQEATGA